MGVAPSSNATRHGVDRWQREVERWARLGVAVVHGTYGRKGPWPDDWPRLAHQETWNVARQATKRGRSNLAVRLGETVDGIKPCQPCGYIEASWPAALEAYLPGRIVPKAIKEPYLTPQLLQLFHAGL